VKPQGALVIPAYNSRLTVGETMVSVASQTGLERIKTVYLVDDASSDDTVETALAAWKNVPTPLVVLRNAVNRGERESLNQVFSQIGTSVPWIFILHSDDIAKPLWLEAMFRRIDGCDENVGSVCSSWDNLLPDGKVHKGEDDPARAFNRIEGGPASVRSTLKVGCWWHISGCAIRSRTFEEVGNFVRDMPQLGDFDWLLRCLARGWAVDYIPATLILYRSTAGSVSSVSFRMGRDVEEMLRILRAHGGVLTPDEIKSKRRSLMKQSARRFVKSVLYLRFRTAGNYLCLMRAIARGPKTPGREDRAAGPARS